MTDETGWAERYAPSLDEFEAIALAAFENLPLKFKKLVVGVPCGVAEFPEDADLADLGMDSPFDLMGLFQGSGYVPGTEMTGQMPNRIWLYRRPILDYWAENEETLGAVISHVLIHEIGHHFGFSDEDLEAIEASAELEAAIAKRGG